MKRTISFSLFVVFWFMAQGIGYAALSGPKWWQISDSPTTIAGYNISDVASITALTNHAASATGVHGVTGSVVGTSDAQTLVNKTIDDDSNTVQNLALSALKTVVGEASTFLSRDSSGVATATKAVPTGVVLGTTDAQTLSNKTIDGDDNTLQDLGLSTLKTVVGEASKFLSRDASGSATATKAVPTGVVVGTTDVQTLTNKSISGEQIDSGTVAEGRIDATVARDAEVTTQIGNHSASETAVHGLPATKINSKYLGTSASGVYEWTSPTGAGIVARDIVTIGGAATTTIPLTNCSITSINQSLVLIEGVAQRPTTDYTKTSATRLDTVVTMPAGTVVQVLDFD